MFGHRHYVPVMRMKPAELRALRAFAPALRSRTTPLLECPPRVLRYCGTLATLDDRLAHLVDHVSGWEGRSLFLDFSMLQTTLPNAIEFMAERAARAGIRPVPVISLRMGLGSTYTRSVQTAIQRHATAVCLRISPEELKLSASEEMIEACLRRFSASPPSVDLVIDRRSVDGGSVRYEEFAHHIPAVDSWRTLTVLAGSFPEDLSRLAPRSTHRLRRHEWLQWLALAAWGGRRPAFGDYTIQSVAFREPVAVPNFSASVRYTVDDDYFVLRGEGVLNEGGPGYGQWNAWAVLLTEMPEFFGSTFSAGDQYIAAHAANWTASGNAQSWLQAGFSHHLTTTSLQVADRLEQVRQPSAAASVAPRVSVDVEHPGAAI